MQLLRAGIGALLLAAFVATPSISLAQVGAALPCPGAHFATQLEADAANPKGSIVPGVTYVCPGDAALGINNTAGAAKDYLKTVLCPNKGTYGGYSGEDTIGRLDPKFAQCAATFLKALNTSGQPYCINEGARTVAKQEEYVRSGVIACKNGAMCEHPRGIAIDINVAGRPGVGCSEYLRAHQLAPQFGLTFYLGCKDAYHFVPQKGGCTDANFVPPTGGGGSFPTGGTNANGFLPSNFYDYPQYAPSSASPYSTAINALTPLLSNSLLGSQQPTQPTATTPTYTAPTNYEPVQLPTATSSIFTIPPPYTYQNLGTTTRPTTSGPSAYEQIEILSGSHTTGSSAGSGTGTSAPTQLNPDLYDIEKGSGTGGSNVTVDEGVMDTLAENSIKVNPIHVTETFSRDEPTLVAPASSTGANTEANKTLVVALLTTLRNLLVTFVNFLKSHSTAGFQGSWQAPATTPVYR